MIPVKSESLTSMEIRNTSVQRNLQIYQSVRRLGWLVGGIILNHFTLLGLVVLGQESTDLLINQQKEACNTFKTEKSKDKHLDIASTGLIPGTQTISNELQKVQVQLVTARNRFKEKHPVIVNLKRRETALEKLLLERVKNTCQTLK
ncbi:hypothetical protein [Mastigocoleus testarum]|uniref:Uncharacterized protein n=1 Tax=Mastigocoleus testarum BC008 TaxID=371196 RepID=A0A0V7ZQX1_9CYAN|nr:hypothetical protein [Mastigocoleus testarum]KST66846.1 hypothetical protein BC008_27035 [Mastigocoleus testarum BC008]KST70184.1 hypothetical protein BC008_36640 [Mastigocoleus testarum BC008]